MDHEHQERIRQRAHEIWQSEGRPEGQEAEHWNRAEAELQANLGDDTPAQPEAGAEPQSEMEQVIKPAAKKRAPRKSSKTETTPYLNDGP